MKSSWKPSWPRRSICLGLLLAPFISSAAVFNIDIENFDFNPDSVTINVNDEVIWNWVSNFHNTVEDGGLWDSGTFNNGHVFSRVFTEVGNWHYTCTIHQFGGNIIVLGGNVAPAVSITSPTNGQTFSSSGSVPITATATDSDGTVTNVSFFDGPTLIGNDATSPYSISAPFTPGVHSLTAVATDNLGLSTTSAVVNISVSEANLAPSVVITNPVDGAVLNSALAVTIRASAQDPDGTVTNVQFFDGATSVGNDATAPFSASATLAIGAHTLTAVATDNLGLSSTSAPVQITLARYLPPIEKGDAAILLKPIATGLGAPDYAISPPSDTTHLFVIEQNGLLRVIENGVLLPTPALDIQSRVAPPLVPSNPNDERGFLGLAFHPGYNDPGSVGYHTLYTYNSEMIPPATLPTFPVPTTATNNYRNVVNEWKISDTNAAVVDPNSRREVVSFGKNASNHNGGTITFGPDGYMYLALGDGGDANDVGASHIEPGGNAQNLSTPLGKMLRFNPINPALNPSSPDPVSGNLQYRIPLTNPFQGAGQVREIFAYGFRNPYRYSFDKLTQDLIVADVGQNTIEEIDHVTIGGNYGWSMKEGDFLFNRTNGPSGAAGTIGDPPGNRSPGLPAGLTDPISGPLGTLEYDHDDGISITGGFVYRGSGIPALYGKYIFGDLALRSGPRADGRLFDADLQTGAIKSFPLFQFGGSDVLPFGLTVHGFGQDEDGEIYALVTNTAANGSGGIIYKLVAIRLSALLSGNAIEISWPTTGPRLQSQTSSLTGSWVDVPNTASTNRVIVPINPSVSPVFYRLIVP